MKRNSTKYPTYEDGLVHPKDGCGPSLTKLEYFASEALKGFCANGQAFYAVDMKYRAKLAVKQAKILIKELNKEESNEQDN